MKKVAFILLASFLFCCDTLKGQGSGRALGGNDEGIASISERLSGLEKKNDALNIFFNLNTSYQERFDGAEQGGSFKGRQIRLEVKGNLDDHWSYRFRYRLNRPGVQQDDNFSNNIDFMQVNYKANRRWRFAFGKKELNLGGFEFDNNPIQVIQYSDFIDALAEFHMTALAACTIADGHELQAEIFNSNNNSIDKVYPTLQLERSRHPLGATISWNGNMCGGRLQTYWGFTYMNEAKSTNTRMLMLGTKLNFRRLQWFVDYSGAWEDVDRHGIISAETGTIARDVRYHSIVSELNYQPQPHWNCFLKGSVEFASVSSQANLKNYRTSYGYQAAVQWIPDLSQDARISLAYIGKSVSYKSASSLNDYSDNRIELSLIYRLKVF